MAGNVIVRALELDGRWVSIGSDSARGIVVEGLQADVDEWGPRSASFTLRRRTDVPWPDIGALTPIEIEDQGLLVWSGRVKGTPTTDGADRQISVNAEGWQYHLDDDQYQRNYVQSSLTDFVDSRSLIDAPLSIFTTGGTVSVGDGSITLSFNAGTGYPSTALVGVTLDFGTALCAHAAVNWLSSNNTPDIVFYCRGTDEADGFRSADDAFSFPLNAAAASFNTGSFATPHRYVNLSIYWAAGGTPGAECWVKIIPPTSFFALASYASGGYSVLKASDVVVDAVNRATLLLSTDQSKAQATSFTIPEFAMSSLATPREAIDAVNAFHNWQARVDVEKRFEYRPRPATPVIQVDQRATFDEASAGDSTEIYSNVAVTYTDAAGQAQIMPRGQSSSLFVRSNVQPTNPGAEPAGTTGWTNVGFGALSRTTVGGEFSAGAAGFKLTPSGSAMQYAATASWSGAFVTGNTYRLTVDRRVFGGTPGVYVWVLVDGATVAAAGGYEDNTFHPITLDWVQPSASTPEIRVQAISFGGVTYTVYFDNLILYESAPTLVNRRHFRRTKILATNMALTPAGAEQIGDRFLEAHRTTPLKGKVVVTGLGTARANPSGASMRTSELLLCGGELVRLAHLIDPDTGDLGREGRIASVGWDSESDTATLELDSTVSNLEAALSRLALITGQVPA